MLLDIRLYTKRFGKHGCSFLKNSATNKDLPVLGAPVENIRQSATWPSPVLAEPPQTLTPTPAALANCAFPAGPGESNIIARLALQDIDRDIGHRRPPRLLCPLRPSHPVRIHILHVFYILHVPSTLDIDVLYVLHVCFSVLSTPRATSSIFVGPPVCPLQRPCCQLL